MKSKDASRKGTPARRVPAKIKGPSMIPLYRLNSIFFILFMLFLAANSFGRWAYDSRRYVASNKLDSCLITLTSELSKEANNYAAYNVVGYMDEMIRQFIATNQHTALDTLLSKIPSSGIQEIDVLAQAMIYRHYFRNPDSVKKRVVPMLDTLLGQKPQSIWGDEVLYWEAMSLPAFMPPNYQVITLEKALNKYPASNSTHIIMLELARSLAISDYNKSEKLLLSIIDKFPDSPGVLSGMTFTALASLYNAGKKYDSSIKMWKQYYERAKTDEDKVEALYFIAQAYQDKREYGIALEKYKEALAKYPSCTRRDLIEGAIRLINSEMKLGDK